MARRAAATEEPAFDEAIAERAYFKAQQRGFTPGHELDDWLAAERELQGVVAAAAKPRKAPVRRKAAAAKK